MNSAAYRRSLPWLGLLCICAAFVIAVARLHPTNFFGYGEDDSIYFSSAKALAQGKGYVLPSLPFRVTPRYPVFYPWALSWIWRWNQSFPSNLREAIAVSVAFGVLFVTLIFLFLRRLKGISEVEALFLTGFCALHPLVVFYSGRVLTEIPFAALVLGAIICADRGAERDASTIEIVCSGILSGLAVLTRMLGLPVALGLAVALLTRRAWRQFAVYCGSLAPFVGVLVWGMISRVLAAPPSVYLDTSSPAWVRAYYGNYLATWRQSVPDAAVFVAMLKNSAAWLLRAPADYFVWPRLAGSRLGWVIAIVVTAVILRGVVRLARDTGARPVHWVLLFYSLMALFWNFPEQRRFLIPFLALFIAGFWIESKHLINMARESLIRPRPLMEKIVAVGFSLAFVGFIWGVSVNSFELWRAMEKESADRASLLAEKREIYDWLTHHTTADTRVVAYEDGPAYLYSGRAAVLPVLFTSAEFYEPWRMGPVLDHLTDVARAVGAEYWIVSDDDYNSVWREASEKAGARTKHIEDALPIVYQSGGGRVRVHDLFCVQHVSDGSCQAARAILFPSERGVQGKSMALAPPLAEQTFGVRDSALESGKD